ncbi:MAG: hypothetical protein M0P64_00990 [Candidatus Pacebacteria bacterium]|nr:hypothetical protein [Candidatus Paceibacterota bacterium]
MTYHNGGSRKRSASREGKREEVLRAYVRGKALLLADEYSGVGKLYSDEERSSIASSVDEAHRRLLDLGLSEQAIAYRAKELALKLLDF